MVFYDLELHIAKSAVRIVLQTLTAIYNFLVGLERLDTGAIHIFNGLLLGRVRFF